MASIEYILKNKDSDIHIKYDSDYDENEELPHIDVTKDMMYFLFNMCIFHLSSIRDPYLNALAIDMKSFFDTHSKNLDTGDSDISIETVEILEPPTVPNKKTTSKKKLIFKPRLIARYDYEVEGMLLVYACYDDEVEGMYDDFVFPRFYFEYIINSDLFFDKYNVYLLMLNRYSKKDKMTYHLRELNKMLFDIKFKKVAIDETDDEWDDEGYDD
jgi:hypothetical protein